MSITIRTALPEDFPAIYELDFAANATHPFYVIPWKATGHEPCKAWILDRYRHLYNSRNPEGTFLIATTTPTAAAGADEIVGYLMYLKPARDGEQLDEEWNAQLPEGANVRFIEKVFGEVKAAKKQLDLKGCWGMY